MLSPAQIAAQHRRRTRYSPAGLTVATFLRKFPPVRWTLRAETGAIYHLWQHERLGWWARSEILRGADDLVRWRPIVSPLVLPLLDEEWLTLTFVEWPQDERLIATHPFLHVAGPIARLRAHVLDGWPGDPPVAHFLVEAP
jgi:hypothetical protein